MDGSAYKLAVSVFVICFRISVGQGVCSNTALELAYLNLRVHCVRLRAYKISINKTTPHNF